MTYTLRPATPEDCRAVWLWRNDPVSRAASLETAVVPFETHQAWFDQALTDPGRVLMIGMAADGSKVGLLRLDRMADGGMRIGVNIAPEWRGRGAGRVLLAQVVAGARGERLTAEVRSDNLASIRLFDGAGFARKGEADGVILFGRPPG